MNVRENLRKAILEAEKKQSQIQRDENCLVLHLMPPVGWLNDPNGLCQFQGEYHVFYQYSPLDPNGSMKAWGHYVSKDFICWEQLETALFPDQVFDCDGVYSGSAFVENNHMYLFYTGNVKNSGEHDEDRTYSGREANTVLVTSADGVHFSEKELLMTNKDYPSGYTCHIRDPKIWKQGNCYYMIQGGRKKRYPDAGAEKNSQNTDYGTVLLFQSHDLRHWKFFKDVTTQKRFGYMWECPDYFKINGKTVLSVSPQGLAHEEYRYQNVYQSGYFLLDKELILSDENSNSTENLNPETFHEWDIGFDFYAPQTFCDEKGRRIIIGWAGIGDADYDNEPTVAMGWQHTLTLPREITWRNGKLFQNPLQEFEKLRKEECIVDHVCSAKSSVFELEANEIYANCFVQVGAKDQAFTVRYEDGIFEFTITQKAGRGRKSRKAKIEKIEKLRLIVDTSIVEIYINDGEFVLTSRFYFPNTNRKIEVLGAENVKMWELDQLEIIKK